MSSDPGSNGHAIMRLQDTARSNVATGNANDSTHAHDANGSTLLSSTHYGGHGASPNVAASVQSQQKAKSLDVNANDKVSFEDELGPIVLNADGSICRIKNWNQLTAAEQEKVRVKIAKRNAKRKQALLQQQQTKQQHKNGKNNDISSQTEQATHT